MILWCVAGGLLLALLATWSPGMFTANDWSIIENRVGDTVDR